MDAQDLVDSLVNGLQDGLAMVPDGDSLQVGKFKITKLEATTGLSLLQKLPIDGIQKLWAERFKSIPDDAEVAEEILGTLDFIPYDWEIIAAIKLLTLMWVNNRSMDPNGPLPVIKSGRRGS